MICPICDTDILPQRVHNRTYMFSCYRCEQYVMINNDSLRLNTSYKREWINPHVYGMFGYLYSGEREHFLLEHNIRNR